MKVILIPVLLLAALTCATVWFLPNIRSEIFLATAVIYVLLAVIVWSFHSGHFMRQKKTPVRRKSDLDIG